MPYQLKLTECKKEDNWVRTGKKWPWPTFESCIIPKPAWGV